MRSRIETQLTPVMKLIDKFGKEWRLEQMPSFYPNMQIHRAIYSDSLGRHKQVRFDWDGKVIGGDYELGEIIMQNQN